jgi:glycosyltransferase involved in cell wall biosynthesis
VTQISVCIPTYNRCSTLRNTISTILDQTYTEFELVVVDNASNDSTEAVIRSFTDPRIRYVRNPFNVGQIENQNRCIEEAAGEIIAIFHDDDIYHPDILRRSLAMLDKYPNVGLVCSAVHWLDHATMRRAWTDIQPWQEMMPGREMVARLLRHWNSRIMSPTTVVRRACYDTCGKWRRQYVAADRELWMRILLKWDLGYIREPMASLGLPAPGRGVDGIWDGLLGHSEMHHRMIADLYRPGTREYTREWWHWNLVRRIEFWRMALWALKKRKADVVAAGVKAFRQEGLNTAALLLRGIARAALLEVPADLKSSRPGIATPVREEDSAPAQTLQRGAR